MRFSVISMHLFSKSNREQVYYLTVNHLSCLPHSMENRTSYLTPRSETRNNQIFRNPEKCTDSKVRNAREPCSSDIQLLFNRRMQRAARSRPPAKTFEHRGLHLFVRSFNCSNCLNNLRRFYFVGKTVEF